MIRNINDPQGSFETAVVDNQLGKSFDVVEAVEAMLPELTALATQLDNHTHPVAEVTGLQTALDGKSATGHGHVIADVSGLQVALDGKTATGHGHAIADVSGLQTALDGKQPTGSYLLSVNFTWDNLSGKPTTFPPSAHSHAIADVTGLITALAGKSDTSHTHSYLPLAGGTLTGKLSSLTPTASTAGLNVGYGVSPGANAVNGDIWSTSTGLFFRVNGVNQQVAIDGHTHSYLPLAGGTLTGSLALPSNGLAVGTNQLVVAGGSVGIGTATPADAGGARNLFVSSTGITVVKSSGNTQGRYDWATQTANSYAIGALIDNAGAPYWEFNTGSGVGLVYWRNGTGGVYLAKNGTAWTTTSDERVKDIIEPITGAVSKLATLRTVVGKYKVDAVGTRRLFLIAQDVEQVFPEAVNRAPAMPDQPLEILGISQTDLIPVLVAAINELAADLAAYKAAHP